MAILVLIADPNNERLNIVWAKSLGQGRYKLAEDAAPETGYKAGDIVEQYGQVKGGFPRVRWIIPAVPGE